MAIDVEKVRKETPGCKTTIHFNNAGSSLTPKPVIDAVNNYFLLENELGGYEAAEVAKQQINSFYALAAQLVNCTPNDIAFIENATRAWDMIFYSLDFQPGDRILTSLVEYASNYISFLQIANKLGIVIDVIPNDEFGQVSVAALEDKINPKVKLIAITHVPTQSGLINPVEKIGAIANRENIFYLVDATQSIGQMPIDVQKIQCDALCGTGRKYLRGPRGTGFLYVREEKVESLEPPFLNLQSAIWVSDSNYSICKSAKKYETWEKNYSNLVGLASAIEYALSLGLENIFQRICYLATILREKLALIPGLTLRDLGENKCGIVTFTIEDKEPSDIAAMLKAKHINVSVVYIEYARLDFELRHLKNLVRVSVHYYNTIEEIELLCKELKNGLQS